MMTYFRSLLYYFRFSFHRYRNQSEYNQQIKFGSDFYLQFLHSNNSLIIDIGANIGNRTEIFLNISEHVVSVEPQPFCTQILKWRFGNKIKLLPLGVGSQMGELDMQLSKSHTLSSFSREWIDKAKTGRFKSTTWTATKRIKITTLDQIITEFGVPQFIKIDVEGFEKEILTALTRPFKYLSFEVNLPENLDDTLLILNYLNQQYPKTQFKFSKGESLTFENPEWMELQPFMNTYLPMFSKSIWGDIYVRSNA